MSRLSSRWLFSIACALAGLAGRAVAQPSPKPPAADKVLALARDVKFDARSVTDGPFPKQLHALNPLFAIETYYRQGTGPLQYGPEGAVLARVALKGVPDARGVPDGEYYLWFGGSASSPQAALVSTNGTVVQSLDVVSRRPAGKSGTSLRRRLRAEVEVQMSPAASDAQRPQQRWSRLICIATGAGAGAVERCARVPAN
jgi:hypothetical protein